MPFLVRPGTPVFKSACLGAMQREVFDTHVERSRKAHEAQRGPGQYPDPAHVPDFENEEDLNAFVDKWRKKEFKDPGPADKQSDWNPEADDICVTVHAVSGKVWDTYQALLRKGVGATNPIEKIGLLREAWIHIVTHAVDEIEGFADDEGPYLLERGDGDILSPSVVEVLERGGWLQAMSQIAAHYQTLTDAEKGNFGG